jgi:hypothetical protein
MRTRNELERLAAASRPLLDEADSLVGAGEEERILERVLAFDRAAAAVHRRRRARLVVVLALVAVLAAAGTVAAIEVGRGNQPSSRPTGHHHQVALSGSKIQLAGYKFRTPAGFKPSTRSCISAPVASKPRPSIDGFAAAASADGGCVELVYLVAADWLQAHGLMPDAADAVDVGQYKGYFVPPQASGKESTLYVNLPGAAGRRVVFLVLLSRGLTEAQLIAVAESGLPTLPPTGPTATTGAETSG